ncbi:MAG: hypothetical protein ABUL62_04470 [Myxococcales bacterium]
MIDLGDELAPLFDEARASLGLPRAALACLDRATTDEEKDTRSALVAEALELMVENEIDLSDAAREQLDRLETVATE